MATQFLTHSVVAMGAFVLGRLCQQQQQHGAAVDHRGSTTATATRGDAQSDEVVESSVVCAGHACIDVVMEQCDELSSREGYAAVERFQLTPGGAVSNTAMQLASLGVTVEAMTVLGNDDFGRLLREAWRQAGVRADKFVQLTDDAPTSCAALPVYKADSKRAVYACPGSNTTIDGEMLLPRAPNGGPDYAMLAAHKFFVLGYPHIMPKLQGSSLRAFLVAVARHCAVALDVNEAYDHPQLPLGPRGRGTAEGKEVFAPVAVLHCNLEEAAACLNRKAELMAKAAAASGVPAEQVNLESWVGGAELASLATDLLDAGCGIVVITLGAHGCYGASADESRLRRRLKNAYPSGNRPALGGQRALVPAFACKGTVNSVGAGDSFLAGIVAALCYYSTPTCDVDSPPLDLAQLLRIGAASSCFKVDTARDSCPSLPVLLKRMEGLESLPLDSARLLPSVGSEAA